MAILEDKIASLFRRVRRLQQSAFARAGAYFEDSSGLSRLRIADMLWLAFRAPAQGFEDSLTLAFELIVQFSANVIFETMANTANLMILIDAYTETLDQLNGVVWAMIPFIEDTITLAEQFNALWLWMPGSTEVDLSLLIQVKLVDAFTESGILGMSLLEAESVSLAEIDMLMLWLPVPNVAILESLMILLKVTETMDQLQGLLWLKPLIYESVTVAETDWFRLSLIASNTLTDGINVLLTLTESLTDLQGVAWVMTPFTETVITIDESLNAMYLWLPAATDVVVSISYIASVIVTLGDTFGETGLLWLGAVFDESIDVTETFNILGFSMVATSTVADGFFMILWLMESITNTGLAIVKTRYVDPFDASIALSYLDFRGVASTTVALGLSYIASAIETIGDSFGSSGLLWLGAVFDDSIDMSDSLGVGVIYGVASTTVSLNLLSSYIPILGDTFAAAGLLSLYLPTTESMSVADALDYVDFDAENRTGDVSVDFDCIKSCPSCYNCDSCEYCDVGACDVCNTCQGGCDNCDECEGCDESCQTSCQTCDNCISCITCINCQSCVTCEFCDSGCNTCYTVCDICDTCDGCQVCNTCDDCDNCDTCDAACQSCNQPCYACASCDTCDNCATCDACQTCYSSCEQCDDFCQTCATCYASCYACDECNNSCELCYQE